MGLIERVSGSRNKVAREEQRVVGGAPWHPYDYWPFTFADGGPAHPSREAAFSNSTEGALALPALYAGTKILASNAASLPLKLYTTAATPGAGRVKYTGPSVFDQPCLDGTVVNWLYSCMTSLVLRGNAWGLILGRDGFGFPTGIQWVPAEQVTVVPDGDAPWDLMATKVYVYGREQSWYGPGADLFHIKAFSVPGRLEGLSLIQLFASTLLQGREAQHYGTRYLQTGGQAKGQFTNSAMEIDKEQADAIRRTLTSVMRSGEALVTGADWSYTPFPSVTAADAQLCQIMQLNASQIAGLLDLPAGRLAGSVNDMAYSSTIQEQLQIVEALRPWLAILEASFSTLIPANRTVSFDVRAMLRTDPLTESQIEQLDRQNGIRTADEIREAHDLAPLPHGIGAEAIGGVILSDMARSGVFLPKSWEASIDVIPKAPVPGSGPASPDDSQGGPQEGQGEPGSGSPDDDAAKAAEAVRALLKGED